MWVPILDPFHPEQKINKLVFILFPYSAYNYIVHSD